MSTTTTFPFTTPSNYSYDSNKVEVVEGKAKLKLQDNPNQTFTEDFSSDSGFTYDSDAVEFSGGNVQQINKLPTNSILGCTYTSSVNISWATSGTLTGTLNNGAVVSGGFLDITAGATASATYSGINSVLGPTGCIKFKFKPNFSTVPSAIYVIHFAAGVSQIYCRIDAGGALRFVITNDNGSGGVQIITTPLSWVSGQEYELELDWSSSTTTHRIFRDGIAVGSDNSSTLTRTNATTAITVGAYSGSTSGVNGYISDLVVFNTLQHSSNYTPGYSLPETKYLASFVESPIFSAVGALDGALQSVDDVTVTSTGYERYTIGSAAGDHYYWNGSTWAPSNETFAQASTAADFAAYLPFFPFSGDTNDFRFGIAFDAGNTNQGSISNVELEYTHQIYATDNPTITINGSFKSSELTDMEASATTSGSDEVKFIINAGGQDRYVTGGSAADSNGTYAQSSTLAEIVSDIENIISTRKTVYPVVFLHSDDGSTTPSIDIISIVHNASISEPTGLTLCNFDGFIYDHDGPVASQIVQIRPYAGFINDNVLHKYEWLTLGTTDALGWFEADIYVQAAGQYWEMKVGKQRYKFSLPNSGEADFSNLVTFEVIEVE